jgi:hypothetical protein
MDESLMQMYFRFGEKWLERVKGQLNVVDIDRRGPEYRKCAYETIVRRMTFAIESLQAIVELAKTQVKVADEQLASEAQHEAEDRYDAA